MVTNQKSILIADDDVDFADVCARRCQTMNLHTLVAHDATHALTLALRERPSVVCLDVNMPSGSGLSVCELIVNNEELSDIPVIMLTGQADPDTIRGCHRMGAYYVVKHTNVWSDMEALLNELLGLPNEKPGELKSMRMDRQHPTQKLMDAVVALFSNQTVMPENTSLDRTRNPWVLMIEDDRDFSWAIKVRLEAHGIPVVRAFGGNEALQTASSYPADLILLDHQLPGLNGNQVLAQLKEHPLTRDIPVIMVSGCADQRVKAQAMSGGAAGFLSKPVATSVLLAEVSQYIPIGDQ